MLGGLNDLGAIRAQDRITGNLKDMYDTLFASGAHTVVAFTLPTVQIDRDNEKYRTLKANTNTAIRELVKNYAYTPSGANTSVTIAEQKCSSSSSADKKLLLVDLPAHLDYQKLSEEDEKNGTDEVRAWFSDHLHYTPQGYDMIAELVHAVLTANGVGAVDG